MQMTHCFIIKSNSVLILIVCLWKPKNQARNLDAMDSDLNRVNLYDLPPCDLELPCIKVGSWFLVSGHIQQMSTHKCDLCSCLWVMLFHPILHFWKQHIEIILQQHALHHLFLRVIRRIHCNKSSSCQHWNEMDSSFLTWSFVNLLKVLKKGLILSECYCFQNV